MTQTNPKKLLIDLLKDPTNGIKVYEDDGTTLIPVLVSGEWYDKRIFESYGVQVTVGGTILGTSADVMDLGAQHKQYVQPVPVNVWVLEKRGANYSPDRVRWDVIHQIDEIFWGNMSWPASDVSDLVLSNWRDLDEPGNKIWRSEAVCTVYYQKEYQGVITGTPPGPQSTYDFSCARFYNIKEILLVRSAACFNTLQDAINDLPV